MKVYGMLLDGHSKADILDACAQLFPDHNGEALLVEALRAFSVFAHEPRESVKGWCLEATRDLYRRLVEVGDFDGALRCVKQIAALALSDKAAKTAADSESYVRALPLPAAES